MSFLVFLFISKLNLFFSIFLKASFFKIWIINFYKIFPSCVLSYNELSSHYTKVLKIVNISWPVGALFMNPMFKMWTLIPLVKRDWTIYKTPRVFLAKRSSLVMIKVSPLANFWIAWLYSGCSTVVPVNFSWKASPDSFKILIWDFSFCWKVLTVHSQFL